MKYDSVLDQQSISGKIVSLILCVWKPCYMKSGHKYFSLYIQSNQKQPSCKKRCGPHKGHGEKRCEIQGGGQEMAVMVG